MSTLQDQALYNATANNSTRNEFNDYQIMLARTMAHNRGASQNDIQITVGLLDHDNLMKYERKS